MSKKLTKKLFNSTPCFLVRYRKGWHDLIFWCPCCHEGHTYNPDDCTTKNQSREEIGVNDHFFFEATKCKRNSFFKETGYVLSVNIIED